MNTMETKSKRFDWDYSAGYAWQELCELYLSDDHFYDELNRLWLLGIKKAGFDRRNGQRLDAPSYRIVDLLFNPLIPTPGDFSPIFSYYVTAWDSIVNNLGEEHVWVTSVKDVTEEWGLLPPYGADWGPGVVVAMVESCATRFLRSKGIIPEKPPVLEDMLHDIWRLPLLKSTTPMPYAPYPSPTMDIKEWNRRIEEFRHKGIESITESEAALRDEGLITATYNELQRDVKWLFERIRRDPLYPDQIGKRDGYSEAAVRRAIRKAAKLVGVTISFGSRRPRTNYTKAEQNPS